MNKPNIIVNWRIINAVLDGKSIKLFLSQIEKFYIFFLGKKRIKELFLWIDKLNKHPASEEYKIDYAL